MSMNRREVILGAAGLVAGAALSGRADGEERRRAVRMYHLSISEDALDADPTLLERVRDAGVQAVWVTGYLYGYWTYSPERITTWADRARKLGMEAYVINVPLGHPGDSLGSMAGDVPLTPPKHWRLGTAADGATYAGTSLHAPAVEENAAAMRKLQEIGVRRVFVDDDFRLARSPGVIGGCYCDDHRRAFLQRGGHAEGKWAELLDDVRQRRYTPLLRAWVDFHCDELTSAFRAMQHAAPKVKLGNMVMYMGSEKAGIRLADYRDALFRVGEGMFGDDSFGTVKNKTVELFSALFHRRYAQPELAYSESTAYPADRLSARNMAAKLAVSTISDVRNTMYMSGLTAFPRAHWDVLAPAMRKHAAIHAQLAGHKPRGPFKHYHGMAARYVGDDNPYSLFLACGVPFEVVDRWPADGFVFLNDWDARDLAGSGARKGRAVPVIRPGAADALSGARPVAEEFDALSALKREVAPGLRDTPWVVEDIPAVCAWYPTVRKALIWNLDEARSTLTLAFNEERRTIEVGSLGVELIEP